MPRLSIASLHRIEQRRQDPRAAGADRVAERDRAAVHVDARRIDPELAHHRDRLDREGFVDLEEVDVVQVPTDFRRDLPHGFDRRHHDQLRRQPARRLSDDARHRREAERAGLLGRHDRRPPPRRR